MIAKYWPLIEVFTFEKEIVLEEIIRAILEARFSSRHRRYSNALCSYYFRTTR